MDTISYSDARQNFAQTMETVWNNREPILITRAQKRPVVMMSLDDYQAMEETAYLLRSPKNAERLLRSIKELENGGGQERDLIE